MLCAAPAFAHALVDGAPDQQMRATRIELNGRQLADGIALRIGAAEEVFVSVSSLATAVDGETAARDGRTRTSRLRIDGRRLLAAVAGGCDRCPARVARLVVISSRVRTISGTAAVPLTDVVAAFEGRLVADSTQSLFSIHVGTCTWCILAPR